MVNQELVRQLLKELEAEKGRPVELRADTPESQRWVGGAIERGREYFGRFVDRPVSVTRVDGLGLKYLDARRFSGDYETLEELYGKVREFNDNWMKKKDPLPPLGKYQATPEGIFADPVRKGHGYGYETKVADISLKLIE